MQEPTPGRIKVKIVRPRSQMIGEAKRSTEAYVDFIVGRLKLESRLCPIALVCVLVCKTTDTMFFLTTSKVLVCIPLSSCLRTFIGWCKLQTNPLQFPFAMFLICALLIFFSHLCIIMDRRAITTMVIIIVDHHRHRRRFRCPEVPAGVPGRVVKEAVTAKQQALGLPSMPAGFMRLFLHELGGRQSSPKVREDDGKYKTKTPIFPFLFLIYFCCLSRLVGSFWMRGPWGSTESKRACPTT